MAVERGGALGAAYRKNVTFLTIVWFLYPVVFLVGPEGLKIISDPASVWAILVMDIIAKVAYAFYAASNLDKALREHASHTRTASLQSWWQERLRPLLPPCRCNWPMPCC